MLGFTTCEQIRLVWGDSDLAPLSDEWFGGRTITLQGAGRLLRNRQTCEKTCSKRAADFLKTDAAKLYDARRGHFLERRSQEEHDVRRPGQNQQWPYPANRPRHQRAGERTAANKRRGAACFVEVEVDTWTGNWRFVRSVYTHDTGLVINPPVSEADMVGSLTESTQVAHRLHSVGPRISGYAALQRRLPVLSASHHHGTFPSPRRCISTVWKPRWFYGVKSFSETTIGAVPGAISNAIFNALRRPHSGTPHHAGKKIMARTRQTNARSQTPGEAGMKKVFHLPANDR